MLTGVDSATKPEPWPQQLSSIAGRIIVRRAYYFSMQALRFLQYMQDMYTICLAYIGDKIYITIILWLYLVCTKENEES